LNTQKQNIFTLLFILVSGFVYIGYQTPSNDAGEICLTVKNMLETSGTLQQKFHFRLPVMYNGVDVAFHFRKLVIILFYFIYSIFDIDYRIVSIISYTLIMLNSLLIYKILAIKFDKEYALVGFSIAFYLLLKDYHYTAFRNELWLLLIFLIVINTVLKYLKDQKNKYLLLIGFLAGLSIMFHLNAYVIGLYIILFSIVFKKSFSFEQHIILYATFILFTFISLLVILYPGLDSFIRSYGYMAQGADTIYYPLERELDRIAQFFLFDRYQIPILIFLIFLIFNINKRLIVKHNLKLLFSNNYNINMVLVFIVIFIMNTILPRKIHLMYYIYYTLPICLSFVWAVKQYDQKYQRSNIKWMVVSSIMILSLLLLNIDMPATYGSPIKLFMFIICYLLLLKVSSAQIATFCFILVFSSSYLYSEIYTLGKPYYTMEAEYAKKFQCKKVYGPNPYMFFGKEVDFIKWKKITS